MSDNIINFDFEKAAAEKAAPQDNSSSITFRQNEKKALINAFKKGEDAGLFMHYHLYETSDSHESFHLYATDKEDEHSAPVLSMCEISTSRMSLPALVLCAMLAGVFLGLLPVVLF